MKIEQQVRRVGRACEERDAQAQEPTAQYGGFDVERDAGSPNAPAHAADEAERRRRRAMAVSPGGLTERRPRAGHLREVAETIEAATGLRVRITAGKVVMSTIPRGERAGVVKRLRRKGPFTERSQ